MQAVSTSSRPSAGPLAVGLVLLATGVLAAWAVGPALQPTVPHGRGQDATDICVGLAAGTALAVLWALAVVLRSRCPIGEGAAVTLLGAAGSSSFILVLAAADVVSLGSQRPGLPGADSGGWALGALLVAALLGIAVPVGLGALLAVAGRMPRRAVAPGIAASAIGVFLAVLLYVGLYGALGA